MDTVRNRERRVRRSLGRAERTGFSHLCFRMSDLDTMLKHLAEHGITPRNDVLDFHNRRQVSLDDPGVIVELAECVLR